MAKPTHTQLDDETCGLFEFVLRLGDAEEEHEAACDLRRQVESVKNMVDRWIASWQVPDRGPVCAPQEAVARRTSQAN